MIKVSDLLLSGCQKTAGQAYGVFAEIRDGELYMCALGTIYYELTGKVPGANDFKEVIGTIRAYSGVIWTNELLTLFQFITDLNDIARKTREEIASILKSYGY